MGDDPRTRSWASRAASLSDFERQTAVDIKSVTELSTRNEFIESDHDTLPKFETFFQSPFTKFTTDVQVYLEMTEGGAKDRRGDRVRDRSKDRDRVGGGRGGGGRSVEKKRTRFQPHFRMNRVIHGLCSHEP